MSESPPTAAPVCYRHPSRETGVRCTRCERPICPDCMREASVGFQCPECVAEGRRTQRPARTAFGGGAAGQQGYVTKALIALNVLAMAVGVVLSGARVLFDGGLFTQAYKLQAITAVVGGPATALFDGRGVPGAFPGFGTVYPGIYDGAYYRLLTAMFVHYGLVHLAFNMYALWALGRTLEVHLGPLRFAALYLLAGLGGNVLALLIEPGSLSAGASTALFGLFAAFFVVLRRLGRDTSPIIGLLVVNLVLTFTVPNLSWAGHIGGMVTGALIGAILAYAPQRNRTLIQAVGCGLVFAVLIGLTLARSLTVTG